MDSSELDLALRFLTQVGIILHFECEIAGLDELYFIDPAWACRTISEIVLSSKVKNHIEEAGFITSEAGFQIQRDDWLRDGRLFENHSKRLIDLVLRPLGIPQSNLQHILRMVEILEMIIQDSQGRYLIPTHLPSGGLSNSVSDWLAIITVLL